MTLQELVTTWRTEAERLRGWGQEPAARLLERCLAELETVEPPTDRLVAYDEAARLSGYSVAQLRRLVRTGRLRDHADTGATMLAVGELPRKPAKPALPTLLRSS